MLEISFELLDLFYDKSWIWSWAVLNGIWLIGYKLNVLYDYLLTSSISLELLYFKQKESFWIIICQPSFLCNPRPDLGSTIWKAAWFWHFGCIWIQLLCRQNSVWRWLKSKNHKEYVFRYSWFNYCYHLNVNSKNSKNSGSWISI